MHTNIPKELAKDPWFKIVEFLQENWVIIKREDNEHLPIVKTENIDYNERHCANLQRGVI